LGARAASVLWVLTLNDAYYQVREAEAQAFYDLFHAELEAESLNDLLRGFLETLRGSAMPRTDVC